jgi:hypothetical protein
MPRAREHASETASGIEDARDTRSLAASLVPLIADACDDRLGNVTWFKADWQRGGAATGTATYRADDARERKVLLKLPVGPRELMWTRRLQEETDEQVVPRLFASDEALGGYDLAWIVVEFFPHGPLGQQWHDDHIPRIAEAAARFYAAAQRYPVDQPPKHEAWHDLFREAQESVRRNELPHKQRWVAALKALQRRESDLVKAWEARDTGAWLHGDLQVANAMSRDSPDAGPVCLIDLAEVHAGHWVEDAVYLERPMWVRPERLAGHKPARAIAAARRKLGLPVEDDAPRLAAIRRALLAATAPCFLKSEGHPVYLEACVGQLEKALGEVK